MSLVISNEEIKSLIIEETEKLNDCIRHWYINIFPKDLKDFRGCCNEKEIQLLHSLHYNYCINF